MGYAEITFRDKNRVKRFLQRQRLLNATGKAMKSQAAGKSHRAILDFGCANAELFKYFQEKENNILYTGYDPEESFIEEAKKNVGMVPNCVLTNNRNDLKLKHYDIIFCLEVFEHLPGSLINEELQYLESLLSENGLLVIGVPNEIFLSAFIRGMFRMTRRYGDYDANFKNVFLSMIGKPPYDRHRGGLNNSGSYIYTHMGFDYRKLINLIDKKFAINEIFGAPVLFFPLLLNTEVNIICRKRLN